MLKNRKTAFLRWLATRLGVNTIQFIEGQMATVVDYQLRFRQDYMGMWKCHDKDSIAAQGCQSDFSDIKRRVVFVHDSKTGKVEAVPISVLYRCIYTETQTIKKL